MSKRNNKLIVQNDEPEQDDLNPFSFREFIRNKNQQFFIEEEFFGSSFIEQDNSSTELICNEPFFKDPSELCQSPECEPEEKSSALEGSPSFELCETLGLSGYSEQSSLCRDDREADEWNLGQSEFLSKKQVTRISTGSYEGDAEASLVDISFQTKRRNAESKSENLQQLREENSFLRKQVEGFSRRAETDCRRIKHLTDELHKKRLQDEREAQDLEAMVQSVEQNLQLMTKRAVKAEINGSKLKQDIQQLQLELEGVRSENERLRCGETKALTTMRHNAHMASEYLNKAAQEAETSIKQLLTGRETFYMVSQFLASIDKITEIHD